MSRLTVVLEAMESLHSLPTLGLFTPALQHFGIDIDSLIPMFLVGYSLFQASCSLYHCIAALVLSHFTSYIENDDWDVLYDHLTDWVSAHDITKLSRELRATNSASSPSCGRDLSAEDDITMPTTPPRLTSGIGTAHSLSLTSQISQACTSDIVVTSSTSLIAKGLVCVVKVMIVQ
ncbi:hypothetical protein CC86DRAFT_454520 [Ophiobolus disseminans]|uniref:BCS1 N-terminal domain-containing protein n=1 Tax=Ophiobolus disseminans TaxID=1469910 RepID=A0A6A7A6S0_9PLEO|nr:hypothetical protein CC86DRAFT_454520 [Ophiobolus disseminans]